MKGFVSPLVRKVEAFASWFWFACGRRAAVDSRWSPGFGSSLWIRWSAPWQQCIEPYIVGMAPVLQLVFDPPLARDAKRGCIIGGMGNFFSQSETWRQR
jgi:hypothetical protein